MAFCTNCGSRLTDGAKFCIQCGAKCEVSSPVQNPQPQPEIPVQESITPAPQQSYQPAQDAAPQQSYTPPAQQTYTPPAQQTYTPPAQQTYTPPAQNAGAQTAYAPAKAPKEKKPMNKNLIFIIGGVALAVIIAVVLIIVLGGKGGTPSASADPNIGVWNASKASMLGMEMEVADVFEQGVTLDLREKGAFVLTVDGDSVKGKWNAENGKLTLSDTGLDCTGTIDGGKLTLSDLMNTGIDLTFVKEGSPQKPAASDGPAAPVPTGAASTVSVASELQKQWNGTWYGVISISEATGEYTSIPSDIYDAYMVVDVDAEGNGDFVVYIAGAEDAFVKANCTAFEYGLDAVDGIVAGGKDLYAYNWMFRANPNYSDQFVISDEMENPEGNFDFSLFMKKWGGSWQAEVDSDFAIVPPSVGAYHTAIANGELPPVGYAPSGYAGKESPSSGGNTASSSGSYAFDGPTEKYNYFDALFVSYPSDTFFFDESAILDTIAAKDESVEISMVARRSANDYDSIMEYLDGYSTYDGYTTQDLTIAGCEARLITHKGDWGDYQAEIFVYFGEPVDGNYGISFTITADAAEDCVRDDVMAIVNSLELAR